MDLYTIVDIIQLKMMMLIQFFFISFRFEIKTEKRKEIKRVIFKNENEYLILIGWKNKKTKKTKCRIVMNKQILL